MREVVKYCNEYVCVCVCLSASISLDPHSESFVHVAYCCGSVLFWGVTKSQGEEAILGFFFPIDNALYSITFGTRTKTAEQIEMPLWMMTRVVPRNHQPCIRWGADPQGEGAIYRGCPGH